MELKDRILEYKKQNPQAGYKLIAKALDCNDSTVRYHINHAYRKIHNRKHFERRRKNKTLLIQEMGGKCKVCGYNKSIAAFDFHHLDPETKEKDNKFSDMTLANAREEIKKCILVCANCHREIHEKDSELWNTPQ